MNTNSNSYTMLFAVAVCVVMSTILAFLANGLKPIQEAAKELDRQKNVMLAAGLIDRSTTDSAEQLQQLFEQRVAEFVVDTRTGDVAEGKTTKDLDELNVDATDPKNPPFRVVATAKDEAGAVMAYVLPVSGKGLWSTLKGYLALEADRNTVKGITFYEHKETPGLGGEVENPLWTAKWVGKTIRDEAGELVSVTVKKGQVDAAIPIEKAHFVDGLSGATITSKGVSTFVKADLGAFDKYLSKGQPQ